MTKVQAGFLAAVVVVLIIAGSQPVHAATDTTPPKVTVNHGLFIKVGSTLSDNSLSPTIPANVTWSASDNVGIIDQLILFILNFDGGFDGWEAYPPPSARQATFAAVPLYPPTGSGYMDAEVYAYDAANNAGWDVHNYYSRLVQQSAMTPSAGWSTATCSCWSGGSVFKSTRAGASLQFQFTGNTVAVVGDKAARRGSVQVYMDGRLQTTVSTAGATTNRVVIYQKRFSTLQTHSVKLVAASAARVDIDGLIYQF